MRIHTQLGKVVGLAAFLFVIANPAHALENSIADKAVATSDLSTLVSLVGAVDLVETLDSAGTYTVFAPTNKAFEKLSPTIMDVLEKRPDILKDIILYHVSGKELFAKDVLASKHIQTLQGESLRPRVSGNDAFVNNSKIIATDIDASNGVVHLIDTVLIPRESARDIYGQVLKDIKETLKDLAKELRMR